MTLEDGVGATRSHGHPTEYVVSHADAVALKQAAWDIYQGLLALFPEEP